MGDSGGVFHNSLYFRDLAGGRPDTDVFAAYFNVFSSLTLHSVYLDILERQTQVSDEIARG